MTQRYHILDFYRFLAATMVMLYHIIPWIKANGIALNLFVDFFFMLSGFVICVSYEKRMITMDDFKQFIWSRLARIYPLHLLTMILFIILGILVTKGIVKNPNPQNFSVRDVWQNIMLMHAWGLTDGLSLNWPSWSISAEWAMYLLTPLFFFILRLYGRFSLLIMAFIFMIALYFIFAQWTENTYDHGAARALPSFLIGIFIAEHREKPLFNRPHLAFGFALFALSCLLIVLAVPRIFVLISFAFTIYVTACGEGRGEKSLFMNPICKALGDASYSIYMVHMLCWLVLSQALKHHIPFYLLVLCSMSFTMLVSVFIYQYFEKPAQIALRGLYGWINVTHAAEYFSRILKQAR
jgi:peptidoglycan/LPS O-acetylase OafA/YrhL